MNLLFHNYYIVYSVNVIVGGYLLTTALLDAFDLRSVTRLFFSLQFGYGKLSFPLKEPQLIWDLGINLKICDNLFFFVASCYSLTFLPLSSVFWFVLQLNRSYWNATTYSSFFADNGCRTWAFLRPLQYALRAAGNRRWMCSGCGYRLGGGKGSTSEFITMVIAYLMGTREGKDCKALFRLTRDINGMRDAPEQKLLSLILRYKWISSLPTS